MSELVYCIGPLNLKLFKFEPNTHNFKVEELARFPWKYMTFEPL